MSLALTRDGAATKRQDKDPGSIKTLDPRLRMSGTSVEDDRKGKGALPPLTPPYKGGESEGRDNRFAMRRKAPARSNHQTFLPGLRPSGVPLVAVIGRPNVGKSTLFNRILGTRNAIVDDRPGVTRDRIYAECTYQGRRFQVVDTGGLDPTSTDGMLGLIRQQSQVALATADILLVIMDGRAGLTPLDQEIVNGLHGVDKPTFWVINKIDSPTLDPLLADFYHLGKDTLFPISAEHGTGVDELLEAFLHLLPAHDEDLTENRHDPGGRGRASQRGQVHAGEHHTGRGTRPRQRHARHHARPHRHAPGTRGPALSVDGYGGVAASRARGAGNRRL